MSIRRLRDSEIAPETREVLEARAQRVARASTESEEVEESLFWVAEFTLGEHRYAIPLSTLRAALPLRMVTPIPLSAPHVIGILRFQGEILAALSMGSLLATRGWQRDPAVLLVVDPGDGRLTALDCEEIPKAAALPAVQIDQARKRGGPVQEVITPDQRVLFLIDLPELLAGFESGGRDGK